MPSLRAPAQTLAIASRACAEASDRGTLLSRRPNKGSETTAARKFQQFQRRADEILMHPLVVAGDNKSGPQINITFFESRMPRVDLKHEDESSVWHLMGLVRPVMYLKDDPVYISRILNLAMAESTELRHDAASIKGDLEKWRKAGYFSIAESHPGVLGGSNADFELKNVWVGPQGTLPPPDPALADAVPKWDYELAEIYMNGRMFHTSDAPAALLDGSPALAIEIYRKATELRSIFCAPFIRRTRELIALGLERGWLVSE